jgi:hypothetical protein
LGIQVLTIQVLAIQFLAIRFFIAGRYDAGFTMNGPQNFFKLRFADFRVQMDESEFIQSHKLACAADLKHRNAQE